jgi:hypothetical protein
MMAVTAAALLVPAASFVAGPIALASVDCAIGEPPWYEVSVTSKNVVDTNKTVYVTILPGGQATRTLTHTTTLTGSITIQVGTAADAGIIIAKAELSLKVDLMGQYAVTDTDSVSLTANNTTSKYHDYVFFGGTRTANGRWTRYYCSAGVPKVAAGGTWFSWNAQFYGAIRCDNDNAILSKYGQWSVQYKAVASCN